MKTLILISSVILFSTSLNAQKYSKEQFEEDASDFRANFNTYHTYPLLNADSSILWNTFNNNYKELIKNNSISRIEILGFYLEFFALLKDKHSSVIMSNRTNTLETNRKHLFPFAIVNKPYGGYVLAESDFTYNNMKYVHSINNIPIQQIFDDFEKYVTCEIRTKYNLHSLITENFIFLMSTFFDFKGDTNFEIEVSDDFDGSRYMINKSLIKIESQQDYEDFWNISRQFHAFETLINEEATAFSKYSDNYGVICPNFKYERKRKYYAFEKDITKRVKKMIKKGVDTLIIDLRGNSGGGIHNYIYFSQLFLEDTISTEWIYLNEDLSRDSAFHSIDYHKWKIRRSQKKFENIFVLINNFTYSAAISTANHLSTLNNVILTGQSPSSFTYFNGNSKTFNSPVSNISYHLSTSHPISKTKNNSVIPDIEMRWDREDMYRPEDSWIEMDVKERFKRILFQLENR